MREELEMAKNLKKYAFTLIHILAKKEEDKYVAEAIMEEAIHVIIDIIYEKHGAISFY